MSIKFLAVDDEPVANFITESYLRTFFPDHEFVAYSGVTEAIEYLENCLVHPEKAPDIILLDINMPVHNGWDFLREFRKRKMNSLLPGTKIFLLTSSIYSRDIENAKEEKLVEGYFTKPLDEVMLAEIISMKSAS